MCKEIMENFVLFKSDVPMKELRAKAWRSIKASKTAWGTMDTLYRNDLDLRMRNCLNGYKKKGIINVISKLTKCAGTFAG